jgi:hypothetical protein
LQGVFLVLLNGLISSVGHKGHEAGELDGVGDHSLVIRAEFIASGSANFELSSHKSSQEFSVLVVDMADIFFT